MSIIDLTHSFNKNITVFPGAESPIVERFHTLEKDGFNELKLTLLTHHGTHMDAPFHQLEHGKTLDQFPPEKYYGSAFSIDCTKLSEEKITVDFLESYKDVIDSVDFILLNTGWYKKWQTNDYFKGFPTLTEEAAKWLTQFDLKGIGLDVISIDPVESVPLLNHRIVLEKEIIIIENMTNFDALGNEVFKLSCFPLKIENADGSPTRAIGITN